MPLRRAAKRVSFRPVSLPIVGLRGDAVADPDPGGCIARAEPRPPASNSRTAAARAGRVGFARSHSADLLIAIHANASRDRHAHGASVWVRSGPGGADSITHLTAGPADTAKTADALAGSQPPPGLGSVWLQYTMIDNLNDDIRMHAAPARQARFYVLGVRGIPGVLLEMGFLSNRHDEALLNRAHYRRVMAQAIRDAIGDYFAKPRHAPASRT